MKDIIIGKAFAFGDNIDTDQIYPGRYLELVKPDDIKLHCMGGVDREFANEVEKGDIVIAGKNFGCGSSREHAAIALISCGVSMVVAESFARIFYRNATNLALPLMVCKDISRKVESGDLLEIHIHEGTIINRSTNEMLQGEKISPYVLNIIEKGGIKELFRERYSKS